MTLRHWRALGACALLALLHAACTDDAGPAAPPGDAAADADSGAKDTAGDAASPDIQGNDAVDPADAAPADVDAADPKDADATVEPDQGAPDTALPPVHGLVITEIMKNPAAVADTDGEWIELTNIGADPVPLDGLVLRDDKSDSHTITGSGVVVKPGGVVVLGPNDDTAKNGGVAVSYVYTGFILGNGGDQVVIVSEGVVVDRVAYEEAGWPSGEGASLALLPDRYDVSENDAASAWCASTKPLGNGDFGTPGNQNPVCGVAPETDCANGTDDDGDGQTDCDDTDCEGSDDCGPLKPGALVVTEIMQNPAAVLDTVGEWIEVSNRTDETLDLNGLTLTDSGGSKHVIENGGPLLVAPKGLIVLGASTDTTANGGAPVAYAWSGYTLGNQTDDVILKAGQVIIDQVAWDDGATFPKPNGASMSLSPLAVDATANDDGSAWCEATETFGQGDRGTPGTPNPACVNAGCGDGTLDDSEVCDDGNQDPGDGCEPDCTATPGTCGDGAIDDGEDCDDGNKKPGDGCSSLCLFETAVPVGAVVVTEIMYNPAAVDDPKGEWFEIVNTTAGPLDLAGFTISDDKTDLHVIAPKKPLVVAPGQHVVLGTNGDPGTNGGLIVDYAYGTDVTLANNGDAIIISYAGAVVDKAAYSFPAYPNVSGKSLQVAPGSATAILNDDALSWCPSSTTYGVGDLGTPGVANPPCIACGNGALDDGELCDDGNTKDGDGCEADCTFTPDPCGNGTIDTGEACDDGNEDPNDGCEPDCTLTPPPCGNGEPDDGEECDDGGQEPGDGCSATCQLEAPTGAIVITEIMQNPSVVADLEGEWFEVANTTTEAISLDGWAIDGGDEVHVIAAGAPLLVPAGGHLVLGINGDPGTNGGVDVDYVYAGVTLSNGADSLTLSKGGTLVDAVAWDDGLTFPDPDGASMQLSVDATNDVANDDGVEWCASLLTYGGGDRGTPGGANLPCTGLVMCGDGACDALLGEDCRSCTKDCGACDGCVPAIAPGCGGCDCEGCVCDGDAFCCDVAWDEACAQACAIDCGTDCTSDGCSPTVAPGCGGCACEAEVCTGDPYCCETAWDETCVAACTGAGQDCGSDGCTASEQPGCDGCACEACVCAIDSFCCETGWDIECVQTCFACTGGCLSDGCTVSELASCNGCACEAEVCGADPYCCEAAWDATCALACAATGQDCGSDGCTPSQKPGCDGCECEAAVCADDPLCCDVAWDLLCVSACEAAGQDCGSDGCEASTVPGCAGCACEAEVCGADVFCCETAWDATCAAACADAGQDCGSDGCVTSAVPGCDGCECEGCVCALDAFCCETAWDASCVAACVGECGSDCGFSCGNGVLEPGEECDTGDLNSDEVPGACRTDCAQFGCGDGVVDPGESCDDGGQEEGDGCSPGCLVETLPIGPGDLVITEIMQNPAVVPDSQGEWFEVVNMGAGPVDLAGLTIRDDGTDTHTIAALGQLVLEPGARFVLGNNGNAETNGGAVVGYQYSGVTLGNGADSLEIVADGAVVDRVAWDNGVTFPDPSGASMSLDPDATAEDANDDGAVWCASLTAYGDGDLGSPGEANAQCPDCGDGLCKDGETCASCPGDCGACSDGCTESTFPGCDGCACEACVCAIDPFCCETAWDPACVSLCTLDCGGCGECGDGTLDDGEECDDGNEEPNDGCSPDCLIDVKLVAPGALVITELMVEPAAVTDLAGEWVELTNVTDEAIDLEGLVLADNSGGSHVIASGGPLLVPAQGAVVLGLSANPALNGGAPVAYAWTGFSLGNTSDQLEIRQGDVVIDAVVWGAGWPLVKGRALSLSPDATTASDNDDPESWCAANVPFGAGDLGTPGAPNSACGAPYCGNGLLEGSEECDFGAANSDSEPDACRPGCTEPTCGDGVKDSGEACDDGDEEPGDGCEPDCLVTGTQDCGNGALEYPEQCDDGNEEDGDGCSQGCAWQALPVTAGALVITEIMADPETVADEAGEWFELTNVTAAAIDARLLVLEDGAGGSHAIAASLVVPAGGRVVLGASADPATNGGAPVDYAYGADLHLEGPGAGSVRITSPAAVVDEVAYGGAGFTIPKGASLSLDVAWTDAVSNDDGGRWCPAIELYGAGDLGSPGTPNPGCDAQPDCGNGLHEAGEECDDGNEDDNDGCSAGCALEEWPQPGPGELVITEIMKNPAVLDDAQGEWIEVLSLATAPRDLAGVVLSDQGTDHHVITPFGPLLVQPGARLVLGRSGDVGVQPAYVWAGFQLSNAADAVILEGAGGEIDRVVYDDGVTFPDPNGASLSLDPALETAIANDDGASWCAATTPFGAGDLGTPGLANTPCPECGDGIEDPGEECDDGNEDTDDGCEPDCTLSPFCSDGVVEGSEECDDGNTDENDGCSSQCQIDVVPAPGKGEVVITEIHADPLAASDEVGEWLELENATGSYFDLSGLTLSDDGGESVELSPGKPLILKPFSMLVLGRTDDIGGVAPDAVYGPGFTLDDDADEVVLAGPAGTVDRVAYSVALGFPLQAGATMALHPDLTTAADNDLAASWCPGRDAYGLGDLGTPGTANPTCWICTNGVMDPGEECDDGNDTPDDGCEPDCTVTPFCSDGDTDPGEECDDGNEDPFDGCNPDCTLEVLAEPPPGAVVFTEIMQNPLAVDDAAGEWVEVTNLGDVAYDLSGLLLHDGDLDLHVISSGSVLRINPGQHLVMARTADIGGVAPDYVAGNELLLGNASDTIVLEGSLGVVDAVAWDDGLTFPDPDGASMQLAPELSDADLNDLGEAWCESMTAFGAGDRGTPGAPNEPCPVCGNDALEFGEDCDDGNLDPNDGCEADCSFTPLECGNGFLQPGEQCDDGNEDDGDGCSVSCTLEPWPPLPGELVISEIMKDPLAAPGTGEWFEVTNVTADVALNLNNMAIGDEGTDLHIIDNGVPLVVLPGQALVLGANGDPLANGGVQVAYVYSGFTLDNDADEVLLFGEAGIIDQIAYDSMSFPSTPGSSLALDGQLIDADLNDLGEAWCEGSAVYGDGDRGTPGAVNPPCPVCGDGDAVAPEECDDGAANSDVLADACRTDCVLPTCGDGVIDSTEECDDGNDQTGDGCTPDCALAPVTLLAGDVVISEIMANPAAAPVAGEWIEIVGTTAKTLDLTGLVLSDGAGESASVDGPLVLPPFGRLVLAASAVPAENGGAPAAAAWGAGFALDDDADTVILLLDGLELDRVEYAKASGFPVVAGASMGVDSNAETAPGNDAAAAWCVQKSTYGAGDLGTPGVPNSLCMTCGDGELDPGEECDDGALNADDQSDACRTNCVAASCGDAVIDSGEQCDAGQLNSDVIADACRTTCQPAECGDGTQDTPEQCDDGNDKGGDGCEPDCTIGVVTCPNGDLDPGEECDDGNSTPDDGCEPDCTLTVLCGNDALDPGEQCEDGNNEPGDGCDADCQIEVVAPLPGEAVITEVMQSPAAVDDALGEWFEITNLTAKALVLDGLGLYDDGSDLHLIGALTIPPHGVVVLGNNADPLTNGGVALDYVYPALELQLGDADTLALGDGLVDIDRVAWDGGPAWPAPSGSSMTLDPAHATAAGNDDGGVWCEATTLIGGVGPDYGSPGLTNAACPTLLCGNGAVDAGEQCDDGPANSDELADACRTDCSAAFCGDGVQDSQDECDDGNQLPDDGCEPDCTWTRICGNGTVEPGEECDDFNDEPGDGCSDQCQVEAVCGNGLSEEGEECDLGAGNSDELPDTCRTSCKLPYCGDFVLDGNEGCDDGNGDAGDGCDPGCGVVASCGNGLKEGTEECDHGQQNSDTLADSCRTDCTAAGCGDGVIDTGELCDDGNTEDGDACPASCLPAPAAAGEVVITELMVGPANLAEAQGEWIELRNVTAAWLDLTGLELHDLAGQSTQVAGSLLVAPFGLVLIANSGDPGANGGLFPHATFDALEYHLANTADAVLLELSGVELDRVEYGAGWPLVSGASLSLDPALEDALFNDDPAAWCTGSEPYGGGATPDLGSPGFPNPACP